MRTTKLVFLVIIGLAMIEFSIGQQRFAVAATTVHKTSHASSKSATVTAKSGLKSHKIAKSGKAKSTMKGLAAVYSDRLNGCKTASGQRFSQQQLTAAHRSLPLGTKVRVTNLRTKRSVEVVINDRGPHRAGRIIDLSAAAAAKVGMLKSGNALVQLEVLGATTAHKS